MWHGWRQTGPVTAPSLTVRVLVNQARPLVRLAVGVRRRFRLGGRVIAPGKPAVVEALSEEYQIGNGVVDCEDDLAGLVSTSLTGKVCEARPAF